MKNRLLFSVLAGVMFLFTSACSDDEPDMPEKPSSGDLAPGYTTLADRTILVYMAANNSLGESDKNCDIKDIAEMREAVTAGALGHNNRLMLFYSPTSGSQTLYEILPDGSLKTVRVYDGTQYVVSADFMLEVFQNTKTYSPAADYGLIMWSHSMGWTQNGMTDDGPSITTKTWGDDRGKSMNISTLRRVLEASPWSWIYFDCCFMGSVEVAYELAPVVDYMVASASELPLDGMPYQKNLPLLFAPKVDLVGAAKNTFDYYDAFFADERTCTVSVLDLSQMRNLADKTVGIYSLADIYGPRDFSNLPLDLYSTHLFYDFGVYVEGLCAVNDTPSQMLDDWTDAYKKVVIYYAGTPTLWNEVDIRRFTGLSTFIPSSASQFSYRGYNTLQWYIDVAQWLYNK